jgi:hypothetical protein
MIQLLTKSGVFNVSNKETDSCLDPELPGTSLQMERGEGPGPPYSGNKSQLEPDRDGENMRRSEGGSILNVMKEDQWPIE